MSKVQLAGNANGTGIFTIASPNSNTDRTINLPDATGTVQVSGNPISGTTGTFSGLIFANGGGVQFPATQVASGDANCLDDYEEGTWSPTLTASGSNPTVSYVTAFTGGRYTKIGNQCICSFEVRWNSLSGGNGDLYISGLPFTRVGITTPDSNKGPVQMVGGSFTGYLLLTAPQTANYFMVDQCPSGGGNVLQVSNLGTSGTNFIRGQVTYLTNV